MKKKCILCENGAIMVQGGSYAVCPACAGTTLIDVPDGKGICPDCKGRRGPQTVELGPGLYVDSKCVTCNGTGLVDIKPRMVIELVRRT